MAFIDLVVKYGWDSVTIMYENNESMMRLKEIFTRTTEVRTLRTYQSFTSHSAYVATSTESKGVKIDGFLYPNFMQIPKM